jgi:hypothetical protein
MYDVYAAMCDVYAIMYVVHTVIYCSDPLCPLSLASPCYRISPDTMDYFEAQVCITICDMY